MWHQLLRRLFGSRTDEANDASTGDGTPTGRGRGAGGAPPPPPPLHRAWAQVPPLRTPLHRAMDGASGIDRFSGALVERHRGTRYLAPLVHDVAPDAPSGVAEGLARSVDLHPSSGPVVELPLAEGPDRPRTERGAASLRWPTRSGRARAATPAASPRTGLTEAARPDTSTTDRPVVARRPAPDDPPPHADGAGTVPPQPSIGPAPIDAVAEPGSSTSTDPAPAGPSDVDPAPETPSTRTGPGGTAPTGAPARPDGEAGPSAAVGAAPLVHRPPRVLRATAPAAPARSPRSLPPPPPGMPLRPLAARATAETSGQRPTPGSAGATTPAATGTDLPSAPRETPDGRDRQDGRHDLASSTPATPTDPAAGRPEPSGPDRPAPETARDPAADDTADRDVDHHDDTGRDGPVAPTVGGPGDRPLAQRSPGLGSSVPERPAGPGLGAPLHALPSTARPLEGSPRRNGPAVTGRGRREAMVRGLQELSSPARPPDRRDGETEPAATTSGPQGPSTARPSRPRRTGPPVVARRLDPTVPHAPAAGPGTPALPTTGHRPPLVEVPADLAGGDDAQPATTSAEAVPVRWTTTPPDDLPEGGPDAGALGAARDPVGGPDAGSGQGPGAGPPIDRSVQRDVGPTTPSPRRLTPTRSLTPTRRPNQPPSEAPRRRAPGEVGPTPNSPPNFPGGPVPSASGPLTNPGGSLPGPAADGPGPMAEIPPVFDGHPLVQRLRSSELARSTNGDRPDLPVARSPLPTTNTDSSPPTTLHTTTPPTTHTTTGTAPTPARTNGSQPPAPTPTVQRAPAVTAEPQESSMLPPNDSRRRGEVVGELFDELYPRMLDELRWDLRVQRERVGLLTDPL